MYDSLLDILNDFLPASILLTTTLLLIILGLFKNLRENKLIISFIALVGLAISLGCNLYWDFITYNLINHSLSNKPAFFTLTGNFAYGMLNMDSISVIFSCLFIISAFFTILLSLNSSEISSSRYVDYVTLILSMTLFASIVATSNNLITFFVALEAFALCGYAFVLTNKNARFSREAALKYLLYGIFCSAIMLYGFSFVYGYSNSLSIDYAMKFIFTSKDDGLFTLIAILIGVGIAFKLAVLPFHFWAPDVYQGAATPVVAYISTAVKACGFAALLRIYSPVFKYFLSFSQDLLPLFVIVLGVIAIASMTFANIVALKQTDIKRLFAYSSIAHTGYILLSLCFINDNSFKALTFYLTVYILTNLGCFWCIKKLIEKTRSANFIDDWRGLGTKFPYITILFFIFLISLIGLPPSAGFSAKFFIFQNLVVEGLSEIKYNIAAGSYNSKFFFTLVIAGLINSVISIFYYLRIIKVLCFDKSEKANSNFGTGDNIEYKDAINNYTSIDRRMLRYFGKYKAMFGIFDYAVPTLLAFLVLLLLGFEPLLTWLNL